MRIIELITEKKIANPSGSDCSVGHSRLSNVRYSQCVSLGLLKHDTGHTDGTGKQGVAGSGKSLNGRKAKSVKYGGAVKDYSGK